MANYINSQYVKIYPSGFREASIDLLAGQNTEFNLTNTKKLSMYANNNSYCYKDGDEFIIYIQGYYFRTLQARVPSGNNLYAYIKLVNKNATVDGNTIQLTTLVNLTDSSVTLDASNEFKALGFDSSIPSGCVGLMVRDSSGNLIEQKFKLSSDEIRSATDETVSIDEKIASGIATQSLQATNGTIQNANVQSLTVSDGVHSSFPVRGLVCPSDSKIYKLIGREGKTSWEDKYLYVENNISMNPAPYLYNDFYYKFEADDILISKGYIASNNDVLTCLLEVFNPDNNKFDSKYFKLNSLKYAHLEGDSQDIVGNYFICKFEIDDSHPLYLYLFKDNSDGVSNNIFAVVKYETNLDVEALKLSLTIF